MPFKSLEKKREYNRKWRQANPECQKLWYQNNRDKMKEYSRRWSQDNLYKCREYGRKTYHRSRDMRMKKQRELDRSVGGRYIRIKAAHIRKYNIFDTTLEEFKIKDQVGICGFCGLPFDDKRKSWEHDYKEFWHQLCNVFKGSRSKEEFKSFILNLRY